jgi:hypothetical protein
MNKCHWCILVFSCLFVGCEGQFEEFIPCGLDPKVPELGQCESKGDEEGSDSLTSQNCAISEHPHCPVGVCLAWQGTESYCTTECKDDTDCPEDSSCQLYSTSGASPEAVSYCVKDEVEE